ncbi:hypothetical protein KIN20_017101 [Parelaphostrongylus tenuis]|uniref:Uncharacterized protein n=1 Tax=Parelaphostrongylus tenuis TaxID=148309 RepID=A0AAD5MI47_PARTN|nr:hypothetical protein KIN20_017101 [Parelaphostrongylus tenuis]
MHQQFLQAYNPIFEETLFAEVARRQNVLLHNSHLLTHPYNDHCSSTTVSPSCIRPENALPMLLSGTGNMSLQPSYTTFTHPSYASENASMVSNEGALTTGSSNSGSEFIPVKQ